MDFRVLLEFYEEALGNKGEAKKGGKEGRRLRETEEKEGGQASRAAHGHEGSVGIHGQGGELRVVGHHGVTGGGAEDPSQILEALLQGEARQMPQVVVISAEGEGDLSVLGDGHGPDGPLASHGAQGEEGVIPGVPEGKEGVGASMPLPARAGRGSSWGRRGSSWGRGLASGAGSWRRSVPAGETRKRTPPAMASQTPFSR